MITVRDCATTIGVEVPDLADPAFMITGVRSLDEAIPGDLAFFEHPKYLRSLRTTKASVVLVPQDFQEPHTATLLKVASPSAAFGLILEKLAPPAPVHAPGIHPSAVVHETAQVDPTACVYAGVVIEAGARIGARSMIGAHAYVGSESLLGEECIIHPLAVLRERSTLGARVIIHSGAVIGSDGFGFRLEGGRHVKVAHRGHVQIDDDVEVGACTTIDRARFGRTWIQTGTKIDNLVQIAHNVVIGPHCLIVAQTGISGSARLGKYVVLAGQVGVVGHVEIGDEVIVSAKSGVSKDTGPKQHLMGMFGVPIKEARELVAHYHRLPGTAAKIKTLEAEVRELKRLVAELVSVPSVAKTSTSAVALLGTVAACS